MAPPRSHPRGRPRGDGLGDHGASAVEYAILLAGAVLGIFAVIVGLKASFGNAFSNASDNQAVVSDGSTVAPSNGPTSVLPPPATPIVTAVPGNGSAAISWSPVDGATSYVVSCPGGNVTVTAPATTTTCNGLTNGTNYNVGVVARAPSGSSGTGTVAVTPRTTPGAPRNVVATPGNGTVTVTWDAPSSDGGAPITNYIVTNSPAGGTCTVSGNSATCTGLTNNTTYTFTVVATNAAGNGPGATATAKPTSTISVPRGGADWTEDYTANNFGLSSCAVTPSQVGGQNIGSCSFNNGNPDQIVFNPRGSAPIGTAVTVTWTICTAQNRGSCTATTTVTRDFVIAP